MYTDFPVLRGKTEEVYLGSCKTIRLDNETDRLGCQMQIDTKQTETYVDICRQMIQIRMERTNKQRIYAFCTDAIMQF